MTLLIVTGGSLAVLLSFYLTFALLFPEKLA